MLLQDSYIWTVHSGAGGAGGPIQAISIQTNMPALINTLRSAHNISASTESQINSATPNININATNVLKHITYNVIQESDRPNGITGLGPVPGNIMSHTYTLRPTQAPQQPPSNTIPSGPFYYGYRTA